MAGRLNGKIAMVTAAGSSGPGWGNGKATAVLFAREGAKVFAVDLRPEAAEETRSIITDEGGNAPTTQPMYQKPATSRLL
jgi:NAD(P)-dependent dehydrogenase (short-subunit alcohol dehydrogenase family)